MLRLIRYSALAMLVLLLNTACHTAQKYIESGNYDDAIDYCIRKLQGKSNKKTEYVQGLELAFQKAQAKDLRLVDLLIAENRPENWEKVNKIHRNIIARQNKISPLLPLRAKDGYHAKFTFLEAEKLERQSRERAADYIYDCAEDLLGQARAGSLAANRLAARDAYDKLMEVHNKYYPNYRSSGQLIAEARQLGTTNILFDIDNQSRQVFPRDFYDRILAISAADLNSFWKSYSFKREPGVNYDYNVYFNILGVDVSPERQQERSYVDEKDIQDGWDYVLDDRGNVKKDTSGNDIKTPRYVKIRAEILEVYQTKAVRLTGNLELFDASNRQRLDIKDVGAEVLFENYASTFRGDRRALSEESKQRIGNRPVPFPSTENMLIQAADNLKPRIRETLNGMRSIQ